MSGWKCTKTPKLDVYRHVDNEDPIVYHKVMRVLSDLGPYCYQGAYFDTLDEAMDCANNDIVRNDDEN